MNASAREASPPGSGVTGRTRISTATRRCTNVKTGCRASVPTMGQKPAPRACCRLCCARVKQGPISILAPVLRLVYSAMKLAVQRGSFSAQATRGVTLFDAVTRRPGGGAWCNSRRRETRRTPWRCNAGNCCSSTFNVFGCGWQMASAEPFLRASANNR